VKENEANSNNQRRAFAIEPGLVKTNMARHMPVIQSQLLYFLLTPIVRSTDEERRAHYSVYLHQVRTWITNGIAKMKAKNISTILLRKLHSNGATKML
jgi:hypothetical protein